MPDEGRCNVDVWTTEQFIDVMIIFPCQLFPCHACRLTYLPPASHSIKFIWVSSDVHLRARLSAQHSTLKSKVACSRSSLGASLSVGQSTDRKSKVIRSWTIVKLPRLCHVKPCWCTSNARLRTVGNRCGHWHIWLSYCNVSKLTAYQTLIRWLNAISSRR